MHRDIEEASRVFADPLVLSTLLLRAPKQSLFLRGYLRNVFDKLLAMAKRGVEEDFVVVAKISTLDSDWCIRILLFDRVLIAIVLEKYSEVMAGLSVFNVFKTLYESNTEVRLWACSVGLENIPRELKYFIDIAKKEILKGVPEAWVGRSIYGFKILKTVSSSGDFSYTLLAIDSRGLNTIIKIPKEFLVIDRDERDIVEIFRGYTNILNILSIDIEYIEKKLKSMGLDPYLGEELYRYREYIAKPIAIVIPSTSYRDIDEYIDIPPLAIEEYGDLGSLENKIRNRVLDIDELVFLAIKILGTIALIHISNYIHMNIKPSNIILKTCKTEPYGYIPKLNDFSNTLNIEKIIRIRPSMIPYIDPYTLIKKEIDPYIDIYSTGIVLYYAYTGKTILSRTILNIAIIEKLYRITPPTKIIPKNTELIQKIKELNEIITTEENPIKTIENTLKILENEEKQYLEQLKNLPTQIKQTIEKMITLDPTKRYKNTIEPWLNLTKYSKP